MESRMDECTAFVIPGAVELLGCSGHLHFVAMCVRTLILRAACRPCPTGVCLWAREGAAGCMVPAAYKCCLGCLEPRCR